MSVTDWEWRERERKVVSSLWARWVSALACRGSQSAEEVRGEQGFWLLAQQSNGCLCDHRQLVKPPCPLPGPAGKLDERQELVRYQMLFLNGIFQGDVNANNCAFTKGLRHFYQNVQTWYVRLTAISLDSLVGCHLKIFCDLGSVMLDRVFRSAVFLLWVFPDFSIGEGAVFVCESHKTDLVSISFCISKVEDMLDICRGRDLGDVNIALSKVLFLMTVWQKREAGTGRFSDIIKVLEHNCSPKLRGEVSFYVAMWHIASNSTIEE